MGRGGSNALRKANDRYGTMTPDELISKIADLENDKKYGLVWEDTPEGIVTQCQEKSPVLREVVSKGIFADSSIPTNLLIEGDNYHSLSVLNYTHKQKIDLIYIDPPYNTGAKDWTYNNDYVDKEDGFRHSKWLSMMEKRLILAKNLLSEIGFICCAIDHNELFNLGMLMDDIFGEKNRLGIISVVNQARGRNMDKGFSASNEYILTYSKNKASNNIQRLVIDDEKQAKFELEDAKGKYYLKNYIMVQGGSGGCTRSDKPKFWYSIWVSPDLKKVSLEKIPGYEEVLPVMNNGREMTWVTISSTFIKTFKKGEIVIKKESGKIVVQRKYREQQIITTHWISPKYNATSYGTILLEKIIGGNKFPFPKSLYAVMDFIKLMTRENSIVLDFFAGSGTTGHAVMELNKEDGGQRQFILCTNNENKIAEEITYPRIAHVIKGYQEFVRDKNVQQRKQNEIPSGKRIGKVVEKLEGNLKYYKATFVTGGDTDPEKRILANKAVEMLCVKENTFEEIKTKHAQYKIYRNDKQYSVIILDDAVIADCKKEIAKTENPCVVYQFSLSNDPDKDAFAEFGNRVKVKPIPEAILRIYKRISREVV